jgi:hypothetical protein
MRPIGDNMPELNAASSDDVKRLLKESLNYREREIFRLRTGCGDGYRYTLNEVAHIFKTSPSNVQRIHKKAKAKFLAALAGHLPDSEVSQVQIASVLEQVKELTPYLITHLKNNPDDLRLVPWGIFEHLIAEFFAGMGYEEVKLMGRSAKTAADIFALRRIQPDGTPIRVFIEVKRWRDKVGVEVVDRVYGAFISEKHTFGWHMAIVVSLAGFKEIKKHDPDTLRMMGVSLKDGNDVAKWLKDYKFCDRGLWLPEAMGK